MEQAAIQAMLHYPDAGLVAHAVGRANLTHDEWEVVDLRENGCQTVERAAETLDTSVATVKRRYGEAMHKLDLCWGALPWVDSILKQ